MQNNLRKLPPATAYQTQPPQLSWNHKLPPTLPKPWNPKLRTQPHTTPATCTFTAPNAETTLINRSKDTVQSPDSPPSDSDTIEKYHNQTLWFYAQAIPGCHFHLLTILSMSVSLSWEFSIFCFPKSPNTRKPNHANSLRKWSTAGNQTFKLIEMSQIIPP